MINTEANGRLKSYSYPTKSCSHNLLHHEVTWSLKITRATKLLITLVSYSTSLNPSFFIWGNGDQHNDFAGFGKEFTPLSWSCAWLASVVSLEGC